MFLLLSCTCLGRCVWEIQQRESYLLFYRCKARFYAICLELEMPLTFLRFGGDTFYDGYDFWRQKPPLTFFFLKYFSGLRGAAILDTICVLVLPLLSVSRFIGTVIFVKSCKLCRQNHSFLILQMELVQYVINYTEIEI